MKSKKVYFFNKLSFVTLLATVFLSLFFFIPYTPVSLEASKGFLVFVGMTLSLFFWFVACLSEGKFSIPRDRLILFAAMIPAAFLLSSFFSSSLYISLFGTGFEIGTFGSMLVLFILFFLSAIHFQSEARVWFFYRILFFGALVVSLFQVLSMFVGLGNLFPGFFQGIAFGNLIGSWSDFALFFGLTVIISVSTLEFLRTKTIFRVGQYFLLVAGLFFLAIINIPMVWLLVGISSVIIFVYSISVQHAISESSEGRQKTFPLASLIVILVSLIFLIGSNSLGNIISQYINVYNPDVRPSLSATSEVAWGAIKHNPAFGTGPNTFALDWALYQPKTFVQSDFWNVDFTNGVSLIATFAATTGIVGIAAWILFLVVFLIRGIQSLRIAFQNTISNYFIVMTFSTALYAWITVIFYTPNIIMIMLAFVTSGMLIGILVNKQAIRMKEYSFLNDPRNSFFSILGLMVLMIASISLTYIYAEKFASVVYYSKGIAGDGTVESLARSETMLSRAIVLDQNDVYYRTLSQVYIQEIGILLNDKDISEDTLKSSLQGLVNLAQSSAQQAIVQNPKQYLNYVNLGNVYSALVPLQAANSYESALAAYNKAQELAPQNPAIYLYKAQLEYLNKNNSGARALVQQAIDLKFNYTDALFFLVQMETDEGNLAGAIKQAERASQLTPRDPTVFFRLGLLRYSNSDYTGAISAFEAAVILDNSYLNARYYLAQSYQKAGRSSDARTQYEILLKVLPDNQDIKNGLNSLSGGNTTPASDTLPAEGETQTQ
jgi:cytochrome c-type biogenesis protein CcmH/NrfG